jgi:hypothetical protein
VNRLRIVKSQRRPLGANDNTAMPINWRRGLFRIWLLLSMAWVLGWSVYLMLYALQGGFDRNPGLFDLPVLLIGPPLALLAFGAAAIWALRGFKPDGQFFP